MPANLQSQSFTLITGAVASSGNWTDVDKTLENTLYYRFSGLSANANATFILEARDPIGNGGYIIDTISLTGLLVTNIATFNTPITNGIRGNIRNINSGSGYIYLDAAY